MLISGNEDTLRKISCVHGIEKGLVLQRKNDEKAGSFVNNQPKDTIAYENSGEYCVEMWA